MKIPYTVNKNTYLCYQKPLQIVFEGSGSLRADDFEWDHNCPKSLRELSLEQIAINWIENPIYEEIPQHYDRLLLLEMLPCDLPLELTVPNIREDVYWKRCLLNRWPKVHRSCVDEDNVFPLHPSKRIAISQSNNENDNTKHRRAYDQNGISYRSWKSRYLEMHVQEYLERLAPEEYDTEKVTALCVLCGPYLGSLYVKQLRLSCKGSNHIPFNVILSNLPVLCDLSICFKQTYIGDKFSWEAFKVSERDVLLLSEGLEQTKLRKLRIYKSDIGCDKIATILKPMLKNKFLKEIDFSHCLIADKGAMAISRFIIEHGLVECITLANNKLGAAAAKALSYALAQPSCSLVSLNINLNIIESTGANWIFDVLSYAGKNLSCLNMAACGIQGDSLLLDKMIINNNTIKHLNLSNNNLGDKVGQRLVQSLESNSILLSLDVRMCGLASSTRDEVRSVIHNNKSLSTVASKQMQPNKPDRNTPDLQKLMWDEEFISMISS